jgi:hypothetical protein
MSRVWYQALGFAVWNGVKWYMRGRYSGAQRKLATGGLVALVLAALLLGAKRATNA